MLGEIKNVDSKKIAAAMVSSYIKQVYELRRKPKLTAQELVKLRELRRAADVWKKLGA